MDTQRNPDSEKKLTKNSSFFEAVSLPERGVHSFGKTPIPQVPRSKCLSSPALRLELHTVGLGFLSQVWASKLTLSPGL